jgi:hypothetical protein
MSLALHTSAERQDNAKNLGINTKTALVLLPSSAVLSAVLRIAKMIMDLKGRRGDMGANFRIIIAGGGTAGWLTACYLARALGGNATGAASITVIESPDIGIIGVGEGTFPTIRATLKTLKIDEARFLRESSATFKQGIRFDDWGRTPEDGRHTHYLHPFEFPHGVDGTELLPHWLLGEAGPEAALADAVTIQKTVADLSLAPSARMTRTTEAPSTMPTTSMRSASPRFWPRSQRNPGCGIWPTRSTR